MASMPGLVDVLLERLATLALDKMQQEVNQTIGVKKEIEKLTTKLKAIRAVLEDAEQRQMTEATVKNWVDELKDVAFDLDDFLDEWITTVLQHQLEKEEIESSKAVDTNKKWTVGFPFLSSLFRFCFGQVYNLFLRDEVEKKIEDLNERLALIDQNKQSFSFQTTMVESEQSQRFKTTSLPNIKTFGLENEKDFIISKLLSESSHEKEVPLIIPIVGMGGMGKTTLAQLVYNDKHVKSHFDKRIWVCVSDPFEEIKIARAIIESLDIDHPSKDSDVLQTLIVCINELIQGKKYLLVLDDVWNPTSSQWGELIKPLAKGSTGSRVLVTTRKEEVATLMKAQSQKITVDRLGEEFCISLFYYNAGRDESKESKGIKDIGLELVKRCKGLPLAAKTLGSLMYNKKNIHEWQAVLNSKTWELKEMQQDVFKPLLLSYNDLTPAIKQCLLYCALFPKDYEYDKSTLIELWVSQDYLSVKNNGSKIIVGENYFHDLVMRSFFQHITVGNDPFPDYRNHGKITCKIHDITHDFLQFLTKYETNQYDCDGSEIKETAKDKVHHLTLKSASDSGLDRLVGYRRLRTLIVQLDEQSASHDELTIELLVPSKSLRTLTIDNIVSIPKNIGELIHLRYLDLSMTPMEELPIGVCSLYNLQTLRLVGRPLKEIDVRRLINLRHLYVDRCYELRKIKGVERLKYLQTLDMLVVTDGENNTNKLDDLKDLNQLQGTLSLEVETRGTIPENNAALLVNKTRLQHLRFVLRDVDSTMALLVMNVLEPPPALESLIIWTYKGRALSDWMSSLHSLRYLDLSLCKECEMLPPLGKLASLENLKFWALDSLPKIGVEFLGIENGQTSPSFPKLKHLLFGYLWSWKEWEEEENSIPIMPCLSELGIYNCGELKTLPDFLWKTPLQKLVIVESPSLKNTYRRGELRAKISHIPNIRFDNDPW